LHEVLIALLGGKGQVNEVGKIFAQTGVSVQEYIAVASLFEPLKFLQVFA
jgi:hypothetical protein